MNRVWKKKNDAIFLTNTSLTIKVFSLMILGGGPFACREWKSLSILTLLIIFVGFSRTLEGFFTTLIGLLIAVLFIFVGSSHFLEAHSDLKTLMIAFSAYGVGLYAIIVISPHITSEDLLKSSRTSFKPCRDTLVRISHVVILFLQGHSDLIASVVKNLKAAGLTTHLFNPYTWLKYFYHFLTSLWLYVLVQSEAYSIALDARLTPWIGSFNPTKRDISFKTVVLSFANLIAAYIIFTDFIVRLLK